MTDLLDRVEREAIAPDTARWSPRRASGPASAF